MVGGRVVPKRAERLIALTRQFDFRYTVHRVVSSNLTDPAVYRYQIDAAKALLEFALGSMRALIQHSGLFADQVLDGPGLEEREREAVFELAEFCKPYDVRITFENLFAMDPGQCQQSLAEVAQMAKAVSHLNLVALIDFSHAYSESTHRGLNFREQLRAMAPVAGHLHVHDSFGRPQGLHRTYLPQEDAALGIGDLHMPLGWGDIEWNDVFSELAFLPGTVLVMEIGPAIATSSPIAWPGQKTSSA
ncbi:sugar phosphate isomerase/epimerase [Mesorhizobium sp. M0012]|uniref:sugar phosphate isomerase/epimerase family protein n=1 Tax=Mesorhizobium sp. M0012 TaxID=2956840 RepID=UPI00333A7601